MTKQAEKKENPLLNLALNVIIPVLVLTKLSKAEYLGTTWGLIVALMFPLGYGIYDFLAREKKVNFLSVLGMVSVLVTGAIGLLKLDPQWVAVKEAAIPLLIGIAVVVSMWTPFPLVEKLLYNDKIIRIDAVNNALGERKNEGAFQRRLNLASWMIAGSFLLSSVLNYVLAKVLVKSPAGTEAFNEELGQMTFWSFPVIALPSTVILFFALMFLIKGLKKLTDLELKDILQNYE